MRMLPLPFSGLLQGPARRRPMWSLLPVSARGGRSGLVAFTTALLFLAALFFTPIIYAVPVYATAPALVAVGIFMFRNIVKIPMQKWPDTVAAFLTIVLMPLTYSISLGLTVGLLSWTLLMTATGEFRSIHPAMWAAARMSAINLLITLVYGSSHFASQNREVPLAFSGCQETVCF